MKLSRNVMVATVLALSAGPALAQSNADTSTSPPANQPVKQRTQGVPQSLVDPHTGGSYTAQKQRTQGVPQSLIDPHTGGSYNAQKQQ